MHSMLEKKHMADALSLTMDLPCSRESQDSLTGATQIMTPKNGMAAQLRLDK